MQPPKNPAELEAFMRLQVALGEAWGTFQNITQGPAMTIIISAGTMHQMGFTDASIRDLLEKAIAEFPRLDALTKAKAV